MKEGGKGQPALAWLMSQLQARACRRKPSPGRARTPTPAASEAAVGPSAPAAEDISKQPAAKPEAPSNEASRPVTRSQARSAVPSHPPDRSWFKALLYSSGGGRQKGDSASRTCRAYAAGLQQLYSIDRLPQQYSGTVVLRQMERVAPSWLH